MFLTLGLLAFTVSARGQEKVGEIKTTPSKVVSVTVYLNTALVTREVTLPEAAGLTEIVVSPLPPATVQSSLYSEGSDGIRVLNSRFRTRAIAEDNREEVRKLDAEIKAYQRSLQDVQADIKAVELNMAFVTKLESFTTATLTTLTDKGQLDSEKTIALATYIRDSRLKLTKEDVKLKQLLEETQAKLEFSRRLLSEKAGGVIRTERDAVIVVDKKAGVGTLKLNYLVTNASWRPQYKLRGATKDKEPVSVEYLAAVTQQTGEDWNNISLVLSTAQPLLNSAPPDLRTLEVAIGPTHVPGAGDPGKPTSIGGALVAGRRDDAVYKELQEKSRDLRQQSGESYNLKKEKDGGKFANEAAALDQFRDLLVTHEQLVKADSFESGIASDGPSVTYRLKGKLSLPSRSDEQTLEITKLDLAPKFYYKAVPVLTPHVYRLADMANNTDFILLPGEATMYMDSDFVGQTKMPLVAIGKPFTVGFGVDPQLQVQRKLLDKTRVTQGGNQVITFKYRILLSSYKTIPVDVQVWDRMPHAEAMQTIATTLTKGESELSKDPLYVRDEKPKNLLRWDVKVDPKQNSEKALSIDYEFKMELDRNVTIGSFGTK